MGCHQLGRNRLEIRQACAMAAWRQSYGTVLWLID